MKLKNFHLFGPMLASVSLGIWHSGLLLPVYYSSGIWSKGPEYSSASVWIRFFRFFFKVVPVNNKENIT